MNEKLISWIESWQLRDRKDVHPSHAIAVVRVEDILMNLRCWLDAGNFRELRQCVSDYINELEEEKKGDE